MRPPRVEAVPQAWAAELRSPSGLKENAMNKAQVRKMSMTGLACFLSDCAFVWWIIGPRVSQHIELYQRL